MKTHAEPREEIDAAKPRRAEGPVWSSLILFVLGGCLWIFKMRARSGAELLPYSPLQILIPLLGGVALLVLLVNSGGHFPKLLARSGASPLLLSGIALIIGGATLHLGPDPAGIEAALYILRWLMPLFFIATLFVLRSQGASLLPLMLGICAGAVASAVAVELYRRGFNLPIDQKNGVGRLGGFFSHANQYGIVTSTTASVIVVLIFSRRRTLVVPGLGMLGIYFLCLFQSLSKTNILLFVLCVMVCGVVLSLNNAKRLIASILIGLGLAGLFVLGGSAAISVLQETMPREFKIIEDAIFDPGGVKSLDVREEVWEEAWLYARENPLLGLGPGVSNDLLMHNHAHNLFLQIHLDAGIAGVAGITLVVLAALWRAGQLAGAARRHTGPIGLDDALRYTSGISLLIYISGNLMSDSFGSATLPAFVVFTGIAFLSDPPSHPEHS